MASRSSNQIHRHREKSSTFKDGTAMHREHQPHRQKESPEIINRKVGNEANVHLRMLLFRKEIPCLVDTGCELTLVPKDLLDRFPFVSLSPSIR